MHFGKEGRNAWIWEQDGRRERSVKRQGCTNNPPDLKMSLVILRGTVGLLGPKEERNMK